MFKRLANVFKKVANYFRKKPKEKIEEQSKTEVSEVLDKLAGPSSNPQLCINIKPSVFEFAISRGKRTKGKKVDY